VSRRRCACHCCARPGSPTRRPTGARVYESLGRRATGTLTVRAGVVSAVTVSLLERPEHDLPTADVIPLALTPFEVRTVRLRR